MSPAALTTTSRAARLDTRPDPAPMTLLRSAIFFVWFVLVSVVLNIGFLPALLMPSGVATFGCKLWCALLLWGLKIFAGLN